MIFHTTKAAEKNHLMTEHNKLFPEVTDEAWKDEWKNMPEFVQQDLLPFKTLTVNFQSLEDMKAFMLLIDQKITTKTKSIWFPKQSVDEVVGLRYQDENKTDVPL